jgi:hypothetical protein
MCSTTGGGQGGACPPRQHAGDHEDAGQERPETRLHVSGVRRIVRHRRRGK